VPPAFPAPPVGPAPPLPFGPAAPPEQAPQTLTPTTKPADAAARTKRVAIFIPILTAESAGRCDHHAAVWRALRRRGLSPEAAEDATQETFLLAAERLADIRPESERSFLIATAVRVAHTLGRKTVRWDLEDDMDQRLAASRDTSDERADAQLCNLVLSKVEPDLVEVVIRPAR
jgi:hypothetical protein